MLKQGIQDLVDIQKKYTLEKDRHGFVYQKEKILKYLLNKDWNHQDQVLINHYWAKLKNVIVNNQLVEVVEQIFKKW